MQKPHKYMANGLLITVKGEKIMYMKGDLFDPITDVDIYIQRSLPIRDCQGTKTFVYCKRGRTVKK